MKTQLPRSTLSGDKPLCHRCPHTATTTRTTTTTTTSTIRTTRLTPESRGDRQGSKVYTGSVRPCLRLQGFILNFNTLASKLLNSPVLPERRSNVNLARHSCRGPLFGGKRNGIAHALEGRPLRSVVACWSPCGLPVISMHRATAGATARVTFAAALRRPNQFALQCEAQTPDSKKPSTSQLEPTAAILPSKTVMWARPASGSTESRSQHT